MTKGNFRVVLYARCSTLKDQSTELQVHELKSYAIDRGFLVTSIIEDNGYSGRSDKRPGLLQLLKLVRSRKVDSVIVLKLDRLFRSLRNLVTVLDEFEKLGVTFISVKDQIDMTTSSGRLMANILGSFAEFEADLIRERTILGLEQARRDGKQLGRPRSTSCLEGQILELRSQGVPYHVIQSRLSVSKGLISRVITDARKTHEKIGIQEAEKTNAYEGTKSDPINGRIKGHK